MLPTIPKTDHGVATTTPAQHLRYPSDDPALAPCKSRQSRCFRVFSWIMASRKGAELELRARTTPQAPLNRESTA